MKLSGVCLGLRNVLILMRMKIVGEAMMSQ